jgi:hypothetical protein
MLRSHALHAARPSLWREALVIAWLCWGCSPPSAPMAALSGVSSAVGDGANSAQHTLGEATPSGADADVTDEARAGADVTDEVTPPDASSSVSGFSPAPQKIYASGVDDLGRFHAHASQAPAPPHILTLLEDPDLAEEVLLSAQPTRLKNLSLTHTIWRLDLTLTPAHAARLGVSTVRAAFKPAGTNSYGSEFKRELAYDRLARHLGARGRVPVTLRLLTLDPALLAEVDAQSSPKQRRFISLEPSGDDVKVIGSIQLWVDNYTPYIGYSHSTSSVLARLADRLRPQGLIDVTRDPLWQALSDMFLLDFLVDNVDRALECGSVRLPDGGQRLVMLDHGDALIWYHIPEYTGAAEALFLRTQLISPNAWDALTSLDAPTLNALWDVGSPLPLATDADVRRVLARRDAAIKHLRSPPKRRSAATYPTVFPSPSRSMVFDRP